MLLHSSRSRVPIPYRASAVANRCASRPPVKNRYKSLQVCVTGKITTYRGVPEIVAGEREQIEIQK